MNPLKSPFKKKVKEEDIRKAAEIVTAVLLELQSLTKHGANLHLMDEIAERMIRETGATPYNLGYHPKWSKTPYPSTICVCIDEEVAHVPPGMRELEEGQIVTYDVGIRFKTACGDASITVAVGEITNRKERLLRYAKAALYVGVQEVKDGAVVSKIGEKICDFASKHGYSIVKDFGGHGIGAHMHEPPLIPNFYDKRNDDKILKKGQVVCIEPILTPGNGKMGVLGVDGWTSFCIDNQPCAMFEHMILVKKNEGEILTERLMDSSSY